MSFALSPEFRRNIWIELTPKWLLIKAGLILLVLGIAWAMPDKSYGLRGVDTNIDSLANLGNAAMGLIVLFGALWGSRQAADAVAQEVAGGTWDSQRLSALSPLSLGLGKLFGATLGNWIAIGLLLPVAWAATLLIPGEVAALKAHFASGQLPYVVTRYEQAPLVLPWFETVLIIVIIQAFAFILGLVNIREQTRTRRGQTTISQFVALVFGWLIGVPAIGAHMQTGRTALSEGGACADRFITWFGGCITPAAFSRIGLVLLAVWLLVAVVRVMRSELQYRNGALVWIGFVLSVVVYFGAIGESRTSLTDIWLMRWGVIATVLAGLFLAALLFDPCKPSDGRRLRLGFRRGDWHAVNETIPLWVPTLPIVVIGFAGLMQALALADDAPYHFSPRGFAGVLGVDTQAAVFGGLLVLLRDLALVQLIGYGRIANRGIALLVAFAVCYALLPMLAYVLSPSNTSLVGLVLPFQARSAAELLPFLAVTGALLWFAGRRWLQATDPARVEGDAP